MTYPSHPSPQNHYPQPSAVQTPAAPPPPLRQVAGLALLVSAGLAVCGSLATNVSTAYVSAGQGPQYTIVTTLWRTTYTGITVVSGASRGTATSPAFR